MARSNPEHKSSAVLSEDLHARVEDYLNDKLQTNADLENIDNLLDNVRKQQTVLKQQLEEAEATLAKATQASEAHAAQLYQEAQSFKREQADIDRRLLIVTQSETSDDAIRRFDDSMEKLQRLDVAKGYVELLAEIDALGTEARKNFKVSPQAALKPYLQLQSIATALKEAQPAAEDAAPHLVDHVDQTARTLWRQMKETFSSEFETTLEQMKWPSKEVALTAELEKEWTAGVEKLLDLQEPELEARENRAESPPSTEESLVLLPLEVMVRPLELRFKYHFDGDRPTNRVDKPEYFLSHIVNLLNTYDEFFGIYLQPIIHGHFKRSNLALNPVYIDSTSAFISALLPMLRRKISTFLPRISKQPQLLSHFIHELVSFDVSLRDEWGYDGGNGVEGWKGLSWEVLVKKDWFGTWLEVEKDFALSRYQTIIDSTESGQIDYDSVSFSATKPTAAAIRVNDLLETITDRYRPLTSFSQKLRFLIDIQLAIFDQFHARLHDSLEAYLGMTTSLGRTMQGVSKESQAELQGLGGLERLCRVYGSAEYLEKKMQDWSDDIFFLELWDELQDRARKSTSGKSLAGPMSLEDVADRTSSTVGSEEDTGALFDETAAAYRRLRIRTEGIMQDMLIHSLRDTIRPYSRINPWSSLSPDSSDPSGLALTAELDATVQLLASYLSFLAKVLAAAPLRRISRQLCLSLQGFLWDSVLMRNLFSTAGAAQFARDMDAVCGVVDRYVGAGQGGLGMRRLREGLVLLCLPTDGPYAEGMGEGGEEEDGRLGIGLREVERKIFESNERGREVLEDLGLEVLTEVEARGVVERRVEVGS